MSDRAVPRGIDHVGLTVPDIAEAERFLVEGLGGELLYEMLGAHQPPLGGVEVERAIGLPRGAAVTVVRMYAMGTGPGIELFQYSVEGQREASRASDLGWQHVGIYVDDLEAAIERAVAAGGELLGDPWDMIGAESGSGNRFCFVKAPFGALVELITFPSPQVYEAHTARRRWKPPAVPGAAG